MASNTDMSNGQSKKDKSNIVGAAQLGAGAGMIGLSGDRLLGKKTMYHGTTKENAGSILANGLKASMGGTGASNHIGALDYVENSKGKVHLTGFKPFANMYSKMNNIDSPKMKEFSEVNRRLGEISKKYGKRGTYVFDDMPPDVLDEFIDLTSKFDAMNTDSVNEMKRNVFKKSKGGKTLKIKMDYDKFKNFEIDADEAGEISKNKLIQYIQKQRAAKGSMDITPEEIVGSKVPRMAKAKGTMKNLPNYIKNNPVRFGAGVALGTGGAIMAAKGIKNLYDKNVKKEAKDYYIDAIEKIAATSKDVWSTYKEKNKVPYSMKDTFSSKTPENFRGTVKTKIRPDAYDGEIGYDIVSTGAGRKNQILEATSGLRDVPRIRKKEDELEEFDSRMKPHYDKLIKNKKNTLKDVLVGTSTGAMGGALLGKDRSTRLSGAIIGGVTGLAGGVAANGLGRISAQKSIIKNLTDDERETLLELKKIYGSDHTQRATSAHRLMGKNYYMY